MERSTHFFCKVNTCVYEISCFLFFAYYLYQYQIELMKFQVLMLLVLISLLVFHHKGKLSTRFFFAGLFAFVMALRWGDFFVSSIQSDEDQWMICARSMVDQGKEWWNYFVLFDFNRILTIAPLAIFYAFTGELDYSHVRLMFLVLFFAFLCLQFRLLRFIFSQSVSLFSVVLLALIFSFSNHLDFIVYNSEMPVIVMLSVFLLILRRLIENEFRSFFHYFGLAVLTALLPFAKEQSLFLSLFSFSFVIVFLIVKGKRKEALVFFSGGLFVSVLLIGFLLLSFGQAQLKWYFSLITEYSKSGLRTTTAELDLNLLRFFNLVFSHFELVFLSIPCVFGIFLFFYWLKNNVQFFWLSAYYVLAFAITLYSIYVPHNYFLHYCILLFPFYLFFGGVFYNFLFSKWSTFFWIAFLGVILIIPSSRYVFGHQRSSDAMCKPLPTALKWENEMVFRELRDHLDKGQNIFVWGWAPFYYNLFKTNRVSGFLYPQFNMGYFSGKDITNELTIEELRRHAPAFIIELVGDSRPYFKNKSTQGIESTNKELENFIRCNYLLVADTMDSKLYRLQSVSNQSSHLNN
jgi:hypothetical protein